MGRAVYFDQLILLMPLAAVTDPPHCFHAKAVYATLLNHTSGMMFIFRVFFKFPGVISSVSPSTTLVIVMVYVWCFHLISFCSPNKNYCTGISLIPAEVASNFVSAMEWRRNFQPQNNCVIEIMSLHGPYLLTTPKILTLSTMNITISVNVLTVKHYLLSRWGSRSKLTPFSSSIQYQSEDTAGCTAPSQILESIY